MNILIKWREYIIMAANANFKNKNFNKSLKDIGKLYADNFILKPTLSNDLISHETTVDKKELYEYFRFFISNNDIIDVTYHDNQEMKTGNITIYMGSYKFTTRKNRYFEANYTFVSEMMSDEDEKIIAHHSSHYNKESIYFT